jgi:hypothetical protein
MAQVVELFDERVSKGIVKEYYTQFDGLSKVYREPPFLYKILMDMAEADPVVFNAVSLTVDLITMNGYDFIGKNIREIERARRIFNTELDFDRVVKNVLWQFIIYGDAYLELRYKGSKIDELHPLETTEMVLNYDEHGEIIDYVQKVEGKGQESWIHFNMDEIVYFRHYWVGSQVYSRCPFKSITRDFTTCVYARDYLQSKFRNVPPKVVYFLKNANEKQRKDFVENLIRAKTNPGMDIVAQGEAFESKVLETNFREGLMEVLKWMQKRVLMLFRVPPHWIGDMEGANRGIGESVVIPYEAKIKDIHHIIASQINRELMPKLGFENLEFKWNAISLLDEKSILENMAMMSAQGFDGESIIDYARTHGLKIKQGAKIEKTLPASTGTQLQDDTAPSRKRENEKTDKMGTQVNKKGVSPAGKEKLTQAQVRK